MSVLDGPGEGTWSVFAEKVVEERDRAREQVAMLRQALKTYYHECKCQHAEMDEVNRQAYAALRATDGTEPCQNAESKGV